MPSSTSVRFLFHPALPETLSTAAEYQCDKGVMGMDVVHPRCAGIDCSKKDAKVCVEELSRPVDRGVSGDLRSGVLVTV